MPGLGIGSGAVPRRRQSGRKLDVFITASVVPASSVLAAGQALRDTENWVAFTAPSNYSTSAGGQTIASVVVNYIGDTQNANGPLTEGNLNLFSVTVTDTGGTQRTFTVQPRVVLSGAPVAVTLAAVTAVQGIGAPTVNLSAGFAGSNLIYTSDQSWATVSGSVLTIADEVRSGTVRITATNSGGSAFIDLSVTITAPVVVLANTIADQSFGLDSGDRTFDLQAVFDNATSYSVSGAGASVSGSTLTLDDGTLRAEVTITVTGSNDYNSADDVFILIVATVPAQMSAPSLVADSASQITATLAAAPDNGGAVITSYDLRYSTDEATWTTLTGITSPRAITGLASGTLYYVQSRAVNLAGNAAWSASASATTDTVEIPSILAFSVGTQSGTDIPVTLDLSDNAVTPYTVYFVAIPTGGTAPSAAQVVAGDDASDTAAPIFANFSASIDDDYNVTIPEATTGDYDFYATVVDDLGAPWGDVASDLVVPLTLVAAAPVTLTRSSWVAGGSFGFGGTKVYSSAIPAAGDYLIVVVGISGNSNSQITPVSGADYTATLLSAPRLAANPALVSFIHLTATAASDLTLAIDGRTFAHWVVVYTMTGLAATPASQAAISYASGAQASYTGSLASAVDGDYGLIAGITESAFGSTFRALTTNLSDQTEVDYIQFTGSHRFVLWGGDVATVPFTFDVQVPNDGGSNRAIQVASLVRE